MACVCASSLPEHEQVYFGGGAPKNGELPKLKPTFSYRPPNPQKKKLKKKKKKKKKKKPKNPLFFENERWATRSTGRKNKQKTN